MSEPAVDLPSLRPAVLAALTPWRVSAPAGSLRVLFLAATGVVRAAFDLVERADGFDDLYVRDLVSLIVGIGTPAAVVALARADGRPRRRDRQLCGELTDRLAHSPVRLVDFLTVGPERDWSVLAHRRPRG